MSTGQDRHFPRYPFPLFPCLPLDSVESQAKLIIDRRKFRSSI